MSEQPQHETRSSKPGAFRQVILLLVALAIAGAAAYVIVPKLQQYRTGAVRLQITNTTSSSMLELQISLGLPPGEDASLPSAIAAGQTVTVFDGIGPIEVGVMSYVSAADGNPATHPIDRTLQPNEVMVLRIGEDGVTVDVSPLSDAQP